MLRPSPSPPTSQPYDIATDPLVSKFSCSVSGPDSHLQHRPPTTQRDDVKLTDSGHHAKTTCPSFGCHVFFSLGRIPGSILLSPPPCSPSPSLQLISQSQPLLLLSLRCNQLVGWETILPGPPTLSLVWLCLFFLAQNHDHPWFGLPPLLLPTALHSRPKVRL